MILPPVDEVAESPSRIAVTSRHSSNASASTSTRTSGSKR